MTEYIYLKHYRLPPSVARDTVVKDCVPLGHVLQCIVIFNSSVNTVTLTVNVNDETSIPMVEIEGGGYAYIEPSPRYFAKKSAFVELTSTDWNNSQIGMQIIFWKV